MTRRAIAIPRNRVKAKISITIIMGDQQLTVTDVQPIQLGGARRQWRKQIAEQLADQFVALAPVIGLRFGAHATGAKPEVGQEAS